MEHLVQEDFAEDSFEEDEIDKIFTYLPQVVPPPSLIDSIMVAIARVRLSESAVPAMPLDSLDDFPMTIMPEQRC